jgi:hypothetical protein
MSAQGDQEHRDGAAGRRRELPGDGRVPAPRAEAPSPPVTRAERGWGQDGAPRDEPGPEQPALTSPDGYWYAIRVQGHLDAQWSEWLDEMTITHEEGGESHLEGVIVDQAALHGLLNKIRDLCLPLLSVQRLGAVLPEAPGSEEPRRTQEQ